MENKKDKKLPGYPKYPVKDDIYNKAKEESDIDPENLDKVKDALDESGEDIHELDFGDVVYKEELDVPGAELDDEQEDIGSEDEENNFYSQGGDKD
ncbi:MAG TPA: hypothetical protein VGF30_01155 [Bacteroidia bacterium]